MKKSTFKGYILEDVISKLLSVNGYKLITDITNDIKMLQNGLNVIGRGAPHQFDSLGELQWNPPFLYPVRLFVEAKFRKGKAGINLVREGVGILADVNQNYSTVNIDNTSINLPRYDYRYAIFSTSGFAEPAVTMALAHKVHLIDLSGKAYETLLETIDNFAYVIFTKFGITSDDSSEVEISKEDSKRIREAFRRLIRVSEQQFFDLEKILPNLVGKAVNEVIEKIGGIYFASTSTPFLIAMVPENNESFKHSLQESPEQEVSITWTSQEDEWVIRPESESYSLRFKLPQTIENYIFVKNPLEAEQNAIESKRSMMSQLNFITNWGQGQPQFCTLNFSSKLTRDIVLKKNSKKKREI